MPSYATPKLEFSVSPLSVSNAAAVWTDISQYCIEATWANGQQNEVDDPEAGIATFVLKNADPSKAGFPQRQFEPEYAAGRFYPNIVPGRRFRLSITDTSTGTSSPEGIWYAQDWRVAYPAQTTFSTTTVTCSDGFWRLSLNRLNLMPGNVETYADVVQADDPFAYYLLNDTSGRHLSAAVGPEGVYRGDFFLNRPSPVLGDSGTGVEFTSNGGHARAKMDDQNVFNDANAFSIECAVMNNTGAAVGTTLATGPQNATGATLELDSDHAQAIVGTSTIISTGGSNLPTGRHHVAATWDGTTLTHYVDGAVHATTTSASTLATATAGEYLYIQGPSIGGGVTNVIRSHVAFYNYPLSAAQIANHATAALSRGYDTASSGSRISTLATDSLWSTAGIPAGTITAQPRPQNGQTALEEINTTIAIEKPGAFFYFNDSGDPVYNALMDTQTPSATFGDIPGEIAYNAIDLVYNDELFDSSTVGADGLAGVTRQNTQSISDYGTRAHDETSLIITNNDDAALLAQTYVDRFGTPAYRVNQITLDGSKPDARAQILARQVGDTIRVRRRGVGGTAADFVTRIIAREKHIDASTNLTCTWTLARGFNAGTLFWHLGVSGFDELGTGTVLG